MAEQPPDWAVEHSPRESELLLRVASAANRGADMDRLAQICFEAIAPLFPFELGILLLVEQDSPRLRLIPSSNAAPELCRDMEWLDIPGEFFAQVNDPQYGAYALSNLTDEARSIFGAHGYPDPVAVPLLADHRGLGVMVLGTRAGADERLHSAHFALKDFLDAVGTQVGLALQRAYLMQRLGESEERYRTFIDESGDGFWESDANGIVTLVNPVALAIIGYTREEVLGKPFPPHLIESEGFRRELRAELERGDSVVDRRARVRRKDGTLRTLSITTRAERNANGALVRTRTVFRDVTSRAREEQEIQRWNRELDAFARVGELLSTAAAVELALPRVVQVIARALQADNASVRLLEAGRLRLGGAAALTDAEEIEELLGAGRRLFEARETVVLDNRDAPEVDAAWRARLPALGVGAFVAAPLLAPGTSLGVLFVTQTGPRAWTPDEVRLIETFARQIAAALDNARMLKQTQARVKELDSFAQLSTLAASLIPEPALIDLALHLVAELLQVDVVGIRLLEGDQFRVQKALGETTEPEDGMELVGELRQIVELRQPVFRDAKHQASLAPAVEEHLRRRGEAAALVPLATGGGILGLLAVSHRKPHLWSDAEIRSITTIANQLAIAIANARLFADERERVDKLTLLGELSRACSATLQPETLLQTAAERVKEIMNASQVSLRQVKDDFLTAGAGAGYADPARRAHPVKIDQRLKEILTARQPLPVADLETHPELPEYYMQRKREEGMRALLMAPLIAQGEPLGLLTVYHRVPYAWSPAEIQFAATIANTIAISLSNARLFESLEQKRRELETTLDSVFSGVFTTDDEGRIQSWNRAAAEITGYEEAAMLGRNWAKEIAQVGASHDPDFLIFEAMAENDVIFGLLPRSLRSAGGREIPLGEAAAPLRDAGGHLRGAVGAFWDRTRERQSEDAKHFFLTEVSHELRGGLAGLLPVAHLLQKRGLPAATRRQALEALTDHVSRLQEFADRFLRIDAEQFEEPVQGERVEVSMLLDKLLLRKRIECQEVAFDSSGGGEAYADRRRLETALLNLLDNAVKFSPPGAVVTVRVAPGGDQHLRISIHNEGPAIPAADREQIFEFRRRGSAAEGQPPVNGYGIGLWLARTQVREMGGDLNVASEEGEGTTFCLTLRRAEVEK